MPGHERADDARSEGAGSSEDVANRSGANEIDTLAALIRRASPMGDLSRFAINDLTAEEEDAFFTILEQA